MTDQERQNAVLKELRDGAYPKQRTTLISLDDPEGSKLIRTVGLTAFVMLAVVGAIAVLSVASVA